ncbi:MAG: DUF1800 domain-containing protein [Gemmatimonadaceae bacterium]
MRAANHSRPVSLIRSTRHFRKTLERVSLTAFTVLITSASFAGISQAQTKDAKTKITAKNTSSAPTAPREQTADQQVQHVLSRLAFGARPGDVQAVRDMGVDKWIALQLEPQKINDAAMDSFLKHFPTLGASGGELELKYPPPAQALAKLAAQQGISRDSAKVVAKDKSKKKKGDDPMMAGDAPVTRQISGADSLKIRQAAQESYRVVGELASAKVARAVASERQLNEVMVDFWENHFNIFAGKDRTRYFLPEFEAKTIRPNALGKFRTLLGAVAKSPAMLTYLDNWQSVADSGRPTLASPPPPRRIAVNNNAARLQGRAGKRIQQMTIGELIDRNLLTPQQKERFSKLPPDRLMEVRSLTLEEARNRADLLAPKLAARRPKGVNENYARELMELHTLGVDGGYTQADVIQVARALTGWTISSAVQGGDFMFRKEAHDAGAKMILGVQFPAGQGIEDGEQVLDMLAKSPATAKFIATKLARRFVSDSPPAALVDRAAKVFLSTDGDIRETVRTIITSPEFFSTAAYRSKVKSPFELVVSTLRVMGAQPDSTPRAMQFVGRLGQPMFGHQAPDGYPEMGDAWMNTGSILNRINFGLATASGRVPNVKLADWAPGKELATLTREQQVDGVIRNVLGGSASSDTRQVLITGTNPFLNGKQASDSFTVSDDASNSMNAMSSADAPKSVAARRAAAADDRMRDRAERVPIARQQSAAARESAKPGQGGSLTQSIGNLPTITGLAQIVGLALGAPEFQRR